MTLFLRTKKGVSLTPEGEYLLQKGRTLRQINTEIHQEIPFVGAAGRTICVGTSIMEKCRLLYDLWVLFSYENRDCEIQMVNIDARHRIPDRTDMIESINADIEWERAWVFYEICKVPFGFAVSRRHPLAAKPMITLEDLKGQTVVTLNMGSCADCRVPVFCRPDVSEPTGKHRKDHNL